MLFHYLKPINIHTLWSYPLTLKPCLLAFVCSIMINWLMSRFHESWAPLEQESTSVLQTHSIAGTKQNIWSWKSCILMCILNVHPNPICAINNGWLIRSGGTFRGQKKEGSCATVVMPIKRTSVSWLLPLSLCFPGTMKGPAPLNRSCGDDEQFHSRLRQQNYLLCSPSLTPSMR